MPLQHYSRNRVISIVSIAIWFAFIACSNSTTTLTHADSTKEIPVKKTDTSNRIGLLNEVENNAFGNWEEDSHGGKFYKNLASVNINANTDILKFLCF